MHAAVRLAVELLAHSSPFKAQDPDVIELPFHEKIYLFRMLQERWRKQLQDGGRTPLFSRRPVYNTFLRVLRDPAFAGLRFHRV